MDGKWAQAVRPITGKVESPVASAVLQALGKTSLADLSSKDLDALERVCQGIAKAIRMEEMRRAGWQIKHWDPFDDRPTSELKGVLGGADLVDHPYRLRHTNGRSVFVVEPYDLDMKGMTQLVKLNNLGWDVDVNAYRAIHYPANTLSIRLRKGE